MSDAGRMNTTLTSVRASTRRRGEGASDLIVRVRFDCAIDTDVLEFVDERFGERWCAARPHEGDAIAYSVPRSAGNALDLSGPDEVRACCHALFDVITEFHDTTTTFEVDHLPPPPWIRRLEHFLGRGGDRTQLLDDPSMAILESVLSDVVDSARAGRSTLVHGAPCLADTYSSDDGITVLVGEDAAYSRPELDWGHLLAELWDLEAYGGYEICPLIPSLVGELRAAVRVRGLSEDAVDNAAVARQFLHLADYATTSRMFPTTPDNSCELRAKAEELAELCSR